jgi:hypothetical protein
MLLTGASEFCWRRLPPAGTRGIVYPSLETDVLLMHHTVVHLTTCDACDDQYRALNQRLTYLSAVNVAHQIVQIIYQCPASLPNFSASPT